MRRLALLHALWIVMLLCIATANASFDFPEILNRKTYRSQSGKCELKVDPSNRHGCGEATYLVSKNGIEIWSGKLPFTLWEACITDQGIVGGYAYTNGPDSVAEPGEFLVVILDSSGKVQLKQSVKREPSHFLHTSPNPLARGLIADELNDRMVVRVDNPDVNSNEDSWWVYELSTATEVEQLNPVAQMRDGRLARSVLAAKPLPGTPLMLVHWWRYDNQARDGRVGARFTLIDLKAKPVWTLDLPKDYSVPGDEKAEDELRDLIRKRGGIIDCSQPNQFDLFFAAESQRVSFAVKNDAAGKWRVTESGRKPFSLATFDEPKPQEIPERQLKSLGAIRFNQQARPRATPIHSVAGFVFDGQGRIAFLRYHADANEAAFVLIDQTGKLLREIPLKLGVKADSRWPAFCWVGGSRFVVTNSDFGVEAKSRGWWIEADTGKTQPIEGFDCPPVERLLGFEDGTFVAYARMRYKYTHEESVIAFDKNGRRRWKLIDDDNDKGPDALFGVKDIAKTSQNEIAVLENITKQIKFFSRHGEIQHKVDLKVAWRREPSYLAGICPDSAGGLIVNDFQGKSPFVRTARDGKIRGEVTPRFPDDRLVDVRSGPQIAPDGAIWTSDGESILRLNKKGIVDLVLGDPPQPSELQEIAGVAIDRKGQIYAVDARTGSIYVFDSQGHLLHTCQTKPTDFPRKVSSPEISINDQGDVYLGLGDSTGLGESRTFAHFSPDGTRQKNVSLPSRECCFQPGTKHLLAKNYHELALVDEAGKTLRTIRRRPDGNWLEMPHSISFASNGSFAVVDGSFQAASINLYELSGDPIRTIPLPKSLSLFARIAFEGDWLVAVDEETAVVLDAAGTALLRLPLPGTTTSPNEAYWRPFIAAAGRELLLFDGQTPVLHRYQLP